MRQLITGLCAAIFLTHAAAASASPLYVDPNGSDGAAGSSAAPFRTIGRAAAVARWGDTVLVAPGRYAEEVHVEAANSGVKFHGLVSGDARPVVDGDGSRAYGFRNRGNDVTIEGFEITGQTDAGVYTQGLRNVVTANVIHHVGVAGVTQSNGVRVVYGAENRVTGNTVHHIGPGSESMGIWLVQTERALVDGNTVYAVRKEGVRDWKGLDNTISSNRLFLNWVGIAFNMSTGTVASNNYLYDNVEGLDAKHTSYPVVLDYWKLAAPHWSRFVHNTVYRSSEASVWVAQSEQPLDYLQVQDNIFDDAGGAFVRDAPAIRGPHVVIDGNAYSNAASARAPRYIYKAGFNDLPGLSSWQDFRAALGWEAHGLVMDPQLRNAAAGDLDYGSDSPARAGSLDLGDALGSQLGARGLPAPAVFWTPYTMTPIDSSSKGTWSTTRHLAESADDIQDTYWMTAGNQNEFVTYDLGRRRSFNHIVLTIFAHLDRRNPRGYRFEVSDDGATWHTILAGQNPDSGGSSFKYELPQAAAGRYLRYTMVDTFCASYEPRTNCGAFFVLSDLQIGTLSGSPSVPELPQPEPVPSPPTTAKTPTRSAAATKPAVGTGGGQASAPAAAARRAAPAESAPVTTTAETPVKAPLTALSIGKISVAPNGRITLSLSCAARSSAVCTGALTIGTSRTLARSNYRIASGHAQSLTLRVTRSTLTALRRGKYKRLRVTAGSGTGALRRSVVVLIKRR